jgi:type II secretory pathway pseudopilin PulG
VNTRKQFRICDLRFAMPTSEIAQGSCRLSRVARHGASWLAFSLIEILVVIALMSVIVLGLMAMFVQVQRAFRLGMTQTDVLEAGRMATDMILREMEQITPSYAPNYINHPLTTPNFLAELLNLDNTGFQPLAGGGTRTNVMQDLFFVTRENQTWRAIGYFVRTNMTPSGSFDSVGTLYRFETNFPVASMTATAGIYQPAGFTAVRLGGGNPNSLSKLLDGVVHFRVRTYDTNGWAVTNVTTSPPYLYNANIFAAPPAVGMEDASFCAFYSNAVPAFVELELGILEPQTYERYRAIPVATARDEYLRKHANNIHLFRQRIAIRNVDRSAYQ